MIQFLVVLAVLFVLGALFALFVAAVMMMAIMCAIGIPIWLMVRHWLGQRRLTVAALQPIDRLRNLYVEGKIDLFEFEQRVARLVAVEH
jgi:hypothetical protein